MAKIAQMPALDVVKSLRGKLDFYRWCGLTIVRTWPRKSTSARSPYATATSEKFSYINLQASTITPELQTAYSTLADASRYTWKDWEVSLYFKGRTRLKPIPKETP